MFFRHRDGSRCRHLRSGRAPCPGGSWTYIVDLPSLDGRRRQKRVGGFATRQAATEAAQKVTGAVEAGEAVATGTVGVFLAEWLVAAAPTHRPSSQRAYKTFARHLTRELGHVKLADLSPAHVAAAQTALLDRGRADGAGLSPTTVRGCMVLLRQALDAAVEWRRMSWNPARRVKAPAAAASPMKVWSPEETRAFLAAVEGERYRAVFWVLATTGMRRGEALGLRWGDVDLDTAKVSVRQTVTRPGGQLIIGEPKSERSRRTITIDPATMGQLRRQRVAQAEERLAWGGAYSDLDLVFAREDGSPVIPEYINRVMRRVSVAAGLPLIRVHDLRHGYATAALRARVNPRTVADRLGHARVNVTLDTYSHVLPEVEEAEAVRVAQIIVGGVED